MQKENRAEKKNKRKLQDNDSVLSKSSYALDEVLDQGQFAQLSEEINLAAHQRENLIDNIYRNNSWYKKEVQFRRSQQESSPYAVAYKQWKGSVPEQCTFKDTYASALDLVNTTKQQKQVKRLINEQKLSEATYTYKEGNQKLQNIKKLYQQQLAKVVSREVNKEDPIQKVNSIIHQEQYPSKHTFTSAVVNHNIEKNIDTKQKMVELAVQKQLLERIKKINEQERKQEEELKRQAQYQKTCFVDMIKRPPHQAWRKDDDTSRPYKSVVAPQMNMEDTVKVQSLASSRKKQPVQKYKLNIDNLLKIPHRQFLIFYSENYHQLMNLSSPQQMKVINRYRDEALQRQQTLDKLKQKIAKFGPQQIAKLPAESKEKLFRVLYEEDLLIEKYYQK